MRLSTLWLALSSMLLSASAGATYSLTAVDVETGEVGGAGASCVPYEVIRIYGAVAGRGALNAQAEFDDAALARGLELLSLGQSAEQVLALVTDASTFPQAPKMQWGIVDARGGVAHATGPEAQPYAGDLGVEVGGRYGLSVQGNLLTGPGLLDQARQGFSSEGCDLAERLVHGLLVASQNGHGDQRCTPEGRSANSAFLDVTGPDGVVARISLPDVSPADPIVALEAEFAAFREEHPCPEPDPPRSASARPAKRGGCAFHAPPRGGTAFWALVALALLTALRCGLRRGFRPGDFHPGTPSGRAGPSAAPRRARSAPPPP